MKDKEYGMKDWYYNERKDSLENSYRGCMYSLIGMIIILICMLMTGCQSIRYVPVELVKTEYVNKTDTFIKKDSVFCRDSIYVEKNGDTVTVNKVRYVYKDKWKEVVKIDSFIKTDSVQVPYPVEKYLSKWEKLKTDAGEIALGAYLLFIILIIVRWLRRRNR